MSKIFQSTLFKTARVYIVSNIVNQSIPFLLIPLLTRYLTPIEYGMVATYQVLVGFVTPITGLSVHGAITRIYYDRTKELSKYVGNWFWNRS